MHHTIKEVSELCGLPESTLRYYESMWLIDPIHRNASKHREYTEENIDPIRAIACLSATGMSIDDMKTYIKNRSSGRDSAHEQIELLKNQRQRLLEESEHISVKKRYVDLKIDYWELILSGNESWAKALIAEAKKISEDLRSHKKI